MLSQSEKPIPIILEGDPLPEFSFLPASGKLRARQFSRLAGQAIDNLTREIELLDDAFPGKLSVNDK